MHESNKYPTSESETESQAPAFHFVCTLEQAVRFIDLQDQFWVSNCGCREKNRSRECLQLDVCLFFKPDMGGTGSGFKKVNRDYAQSIMKEAKKNHLVPRPFRDDNNPDQIQGICFCCQDCCSYFQEKNEICDKGEFIEHTNHVACIACGTCADVCYFGARKIKDGELQIDDSLCFGCGLCAEVCPMHCITMINRTARPPAQP